MLSVHDLTRAYGDKTVLDGVTFDVRPGRMTGFVGANGAGKTTTMRAISAMIGHKGTVRFDGHPLPAKPDAVLRAGISQVPQGRGTFTDLSVEDNLLAGAYVRRDKDGFVGVWGAPRRFGFTIRLQSLEEALAWVNREPQPFATTKIAVSEPGQ